MYRLGSVSHDTLEKVLQIKEREGISSLKYILDDKPLRDYQTLSVAIGCLTRRLLIGDEVGLGKTIQASALIRALECRGKLGKILWISPSYSIYQTIASVYKSTGKQLIPVLGNARQIDRVMDNYNVLAFDGIITSHSSMGQSKNFSKRFIPILKYFDTIIYDESHTLGSGESIRYYTTKYLFRYFKNRFMLSGTASTGNLMQIANQLSILDEKLLPNATALNNEYAIYGKVNKYAKFKTIVGYVENSRLINTVPCHYIARTRKDLGAVISRNIKVLRANLTSWQLKNISTTNYREVLFNPTSIQMDFKETIETIPALGVLYQRVSERFANEKKIVVYMFNSNIKHTFKDILKKYLPTAKVGIVDGEDNATSEERENVRKQFEEGDLNIIITNITDSLNLGVAKSIVFYDTPHNYRQVMGRIERDFNIVDKNYDFIVPMHEYYINYLVNLHRKETNTNIILDRDETILQDILERLRYEIQLDRTYNLELK